MSNIYLSVIVFITMFSPVVGNRIVPLKDNANIQRVFNRKEISSLNMIVKFFDNVIVKHKNKADINEAYHEYLKKIAASESLDGIRKDVDSTKSPSVKALIDRLKKNGVFGEIWKYSYGYNPITKDTMTVKLSLNFQGKYYRLLGLRGENDNLIKRYYNSLRISGRIDPMCVAIVLKQYKNVDFNLKINRLIWAVHYITVLSREPYLKNR